MKGSALTKFTRHYLGHSLLSGMMIALPVSAASVPVVDSQPIDRYVSSSVEASHVLEQSAVSSSNNTEATGTAYLLNTMEQLRQEIMELRGQFEEQQFQINQLRQEGRDRYLDLDERLTQRSNTRNVQPVVAPRTTTISEPDSTVISTSTANEQHAINKAIDKTTDKAALEAEEKNYQAAFQLIRDKQFDEASKALKQQLEQYPKGDFADNAHYWLGEVQMAQGQYAGAKISFQQVLADFPKSSKVPDATYKLGRVYDLLGDKAKAKETLQSVINQYPGTAAGRLSDSYLRSLQRN